MTILTRPEFKTIFKMISSDSPASDSMSKLIAPMILNQSVGLYADFISGVSTSLKEIGTGVVKRTLEKMDLEFRNSPGRSQRYYVKSTRERTIITIFGEVTYLRTEYTDRTSGKPFIYVDEEIGLFRKQRYDSTIAALAYDYYSHQSSMAETGRLIGDFIAGFRLDPDRYKYHISRQQIFSMINRFSSIQIETEQAIRTPDTLYIMADEKYIHLQQEKAGYKEELLKQGYTVKEIVEACKSRHFSEMVKLAVVFTGREQLKDKNGLPLKYPRWKLKETKYLAYPHDTKNFWPNVMDELSFMYDMKKVKRIYVLGDGAEWIRSGTGELSSQYCKAEFALDRYHLSKKINTITKEKAYRRLLTDYIVHGDRDSFLKTIDALYQNTEKTDKVTDSINYILKHMGAAVIMQNEVRIGCAMEQAISHVLASPFTCIPKAYVSSHLHTYVQARILYKNNQDLTRIYISACDNATTANRSESYNIDIDLTKEDLDFSIFDSKATDPYYHADLSTIDHRVR